MHLNDNIAASLRKAFNKNTRGQAFGVELEFERYNGRWPDDVRYWNITGDGSLRNNGVEFVSKVLPEKDVRPALVEIGTLIARTGVEVHDRCGVHVHLNMLPYTWSNLYSFTVLYTLLEPSIFAKWAPGRMKSHFCTPTFANNHLGRQLMRDNVMLRQGRPITEAVQQEEAPQEIRVDPHHWLLDEPPDDIIQRERLPGGVERVVHAGGRVQVRPVRRRVVPGRPAPRPRVDLSILQSNKYNAVNYSTLGTIGTIELRHLGATTNIQRLNNWITFLAQLQRTANTYADPLEVIDRYDKVGLRQLGLECGIEPQNIDPEDQEQAEDIANFAAGYNPPKWEELDWNLNREIA